MPKSDKHCKDCSFFNPKKESVGECRRYAPRALLSFERPPLLVKNIINAWPDVAPEDWCGEFDKA